MIRTSLWALTLVALTAPLNAQTRISALPAASALSGTEVLPVVQSGATRGTTTAQVANSVLATRGYTGLGAYRTVSLPAALSPYMAGINLGTMQLYEDPERTVGVLGRDLKTVFGDFSPALSNPGITYYVNLITGADTNTCTAVGTPCKSINKAIALGNSSGATSEKIIVQGSGSGVKYDRINCGSAVVGGTGRPNIDIALIARGGIVICSTADTAVSYTADTTYTNTYSAVPYTTGSDPGAVTTVRDIRGKPDRWGHQSEFLPVTSAAIVNSSTDNVWFQDSTSKKIYIHRRDGQAVTPTNTNVLLPSSNMKFTNQTNVYVGSDDGSSWGFEGGAAALGVIITTPSAATRSIAIAENAYARYSLNGFAVDGFNGAMIVKDSETGGTYNDGLNPHNAGTTTGVNTLLMAVNVTCGDTGTNSSATVSNQCMTGHENTAAVSLAGRFVDTGGGNFLSSGTSLNVILGTTLGPDRGDAYGGGYAQMAALVGAVEGSSFWLDGVRMQGYAPMSALRNSGTGSIVTKNMAPLTLPIVNTGGGTVTLNGW